MAASPPDRLPAAMPSSPPPRFRSLLLRGVLLAVSVVVAVGAAELLVRAMPAAPLAAPFYQDGKRQKVDFGRAEATLPFIQVEPTAPAGRIRNSFAPGATFYICFEDPSWDYFDDQGCVEYVINSRGVRDREELCAPKPAGQRRVVCVGDSFTLGWGVRVEDSWTRLVEDQLRQSDDNLRTVNCGASGALFVDEYQAALEARFAAFEPDVVLVTLCLNDLIPSTHVLSVRAGRIPWLLRESRLFGALFAEQRLRAELGPPPDGSDVVQSLLDLPAPFYDAIGWIKASGVGRDQLWPGEGPQRGLLAMREWCAARGIRFAVAIWPFLQGLGPNEEYPLTTVHRLVAAFCAQHSIPCHDVLPALQGHDTASLWVHPSDLHPNHTAQRLAAPGIAAFLRSQLGL